MKRIAVALIVATTALAIRAAVPAISSQSNNGWVVITSKQHDKLLLLKVRKEIPADVHPASYPTAIEMHWKYAPDANGMPAEKVVGQIAKFEAAIGPIEGDRVGYLTMIVTGTGERTWLWYTADPKAFARELNRLLPGHPYPIALNVGAKEADWQTYRAMRTKVH